jgi:DNA-binding transcriptional LysR family regulator
MVFVCSAEHALASSSLVSAREVARQRFVAFDRSLSIRKAVDRALRNHNVRVEVAMQFDNIETIKQAITTQDAVSILPQPSVNREVEEGVLVAIPLDMPELVRPVGIIHRKKPLGPTTSAWVEFLQQYRVGDRVTPA